jgi:hypothetical protein
VPINLPEKPLKSVKQLECIFIDETGSEQGQKLISSIEYDKELFKLVKLSTLSSIGLPKYQLFPIDSKPQRKGKPQKPRSDKEIKIKSTASPHDVGISIRKGIELLEKGHIIRFSLFKRKGKNQIVELLEEIKIAVKEIGKPGETKSLKGDNIQLFVHPISK